MGALSQARVLGGSVSLAICTNILNNKVKAGSGILSPQQLDGLLHSAQTIKTLPPNVQQEIKKYFGRGYNEEMQTLIAFGGAAVLASLLMWERQPRRMNQ